MSNTHNPEAVVTPAAAPEEYEAPMVVEVGAAAELVQGMGMDLFDPDNTTKLV
jgi:hypothetical protein